MRHGDVGARRELYLAWDSADAVGASCLDVPLLDNTHLTMLDVGVAPAARGRGVGSSLVEHAKRRTEQLGRRSSVVEVNQPLSAGDEHPYARFAGRHGFTRRLVELHQMLELPVSEGHLHDLASEAAGHHRVYRLVSWGDRCPDTHIEQFCALLSAMGSEAPQGELDMEPEHWDEARLRDVEERRLAQARSGLTTVAVSRDGSLAGYTQLAVPHHDPPNVFQWDTLVLPQHRGHRLGLALKIANLVRVQADHPDRRVIHTWNAQSNEPMIAVNANLGFRAVERLEEWQADLSPPTQPEPAG